MIRLGVNLDHIATVRQAREEIYPDPVQAAVLAELGGADNITCHLREDRRHMQDRDIVLLRESIGIPLNFEMAATDAMLMIARKVKPQAVTLVPEKREEKTTEGGLDVHANADRLKAVIHSLQDCGILVALFIEADRKVIDGCQQLGVEAIEIHTGGFCHKMGQAKRLGEQRALLAPLQEAATHAANLGLQVHFGHGLHYHNAHWLQLIPEAVEANIGHAIVARAIFQGLQQAVREMKELLNNPQFRPY